MLPLEKRYVVLRTSAESSEITVLELVDETSQSPNIVKTAVLRIGNDDYDTLGNLPIRKKLKITIEVVGKTQ